jgi:hypothetical protein
VQRRQGRGPVAGVLPGIQQHRPQSLRGHRADLVALQGDQRRDDHREPAEDQPGDLIDGGLAAAGRQHGQRVAPGDDRLGGVQLRGTQGETEDLGGALLDQAHCTASSCAAGTGRPKW